MPFDANAGVNRGRVAVLGAVTELVFIIFMADRASSETCLVSKMANCAVYEMSMSSQPVSPSTTSLRSNLESFLDCTTPSLPAQYLSKTCLRDLAPNKWWQPSEAESAKYFSLGDLWDCYDEWSAYGAGVPILLNSGETVFQYYVPYLSALQIYTSNGTRSFSNFRNIRDESDASDFELRDSSSDSCSDSESGNFSERSLSFRSESCNSSEKSGAWDAASEDCGVDHDHLWHLRDRLGYLCLQYFEQSAPYARVPLMEKVNQLARGFPELLSLRSIDLSPASWMSVAWYPIYHIPTGRTVRDLSACFLTYHTLSSSFQENEIGEGDTESGAETEFVKTKTKDSQFITLPSFGLSTYKLQGSLWTSAGSVDQQRIFSLLSSADSWLKQLRVRHPDFEFFVSHNV
eukprot:Gb_15789 [translate_table: standard]